jgi:hypothetical protein
MGRSSSLALGREQTGVVGELDACGVRLGVLLPDLLHCGAVLAQPSDLDGRCGVGGEDGRGDADLGGCVGVGQPGVAAGSGDDAPGRVQRAGLEAGQDAVERARCLELRSTLSI